ncbi:hypothetical protein D3C85_933580 [compost metagenome]
MNRDKPPINQGTASPPAKKDLRFRPVRENSKPIIIMNTENTTITVVSITEFIWFFIYYKSLTVFVATLFKYAANSAGTCFGTYSSFSGDSLNNKAYQIKDPRYLPASLA